MKYPKYPIYPKYPNSILIVNRRYRCYRYYRYYSEMIGYRCATDGIVMSSYEPVKNPSWTRNWSLIGGGVLTKDNIDNLGDNYKQL